ncbi:uncharacterized protein ACB058_007529 [Synchiropus picturatus]
MNDGRALPTLQVNERKGEERDTALCASRETRNTHRKMTCGTPLFMTTYLLFVMGCVAQKVYFDCGAKVDVVDVQGLILSPGFPYNYSSGTHCVWQFFVPVDYQLILEIFDFDVFENHEAGLQYSAALDFEEEVGEDVTFSPSSLEAYDDDGGGNKGLKPQSAAKESEEKQVVVQEQSTKMEITKVSNSAKRSTDGSSERTNASTYQPGEKAAAESHLRLDFDPNSYPGGVTEATVSLSTDSVTVTPETQQSILDACPHDVLYISDLITFSSRFCGSNRPPSSQLVFGSNQEMVEVIMELITTTHWGRGFALLFHYHNLTEPGGDGPAVLSASTRVDSLLAAVSGAAFFAMILTSALCIIFRPKLCPKRDSSCASSNSEVPEEVQTTVAEVSELQLMAENQTNVPASTEPVNHNNTQHSSVAAGESVQDADLSTSRLTELDLGADEVFIISSPSSPCRLPFSPHTQRERLLRHSDTGPGPAADWPSQDSSPSTGGSRAAKDGSSRPRAWSVRTFQDFFPPLPQLHKKWCSWNSTSPFTKLMDSGPPTLASDHGRKVLSDVHLEASADASAVSDSSASNASYPLAQQAHRQRRLNSTSNLRRSRFTGPCFGLLSGAADPTKTTALPQNSQPEPNANCSASNQSQAESVQAGKKRGEGEHVSVPVFAISEEEDRQPLVSADQLDQGPAVPNGLTGGAFEAKLTAATSPNHQRARPEWRPWGSQVTGALLPYKTAMTETDQPTLGPVLCSVKDQV